MTDIVIPSHTVQEGMQRISNFLEVIAKNNLTLKLKKCKFFEKVEYLGFKYRQPEYDQENSKQKPLKVIKDPIMYISCSGSNGTISCISAQPQV